MSNLPKTVVYSTPTDTTREINMSLYYMSLDAWAKPYDNYFNIDIAGREWVWYLNRSKKEVVVCPVGYGGGGLVLVLIWQNEVSYIVESKEEWVEWVKLYNRSRKTSIGPEKSCTLEEAEALLQDKKAIH